MEKWFGIVGFVLSLVAFLGLYINLFMGLIIGILALIFCIIQFKKGKTGLAIAGLVLSIIIIVWVLVIILLGILAMQAVEGAIDQGVSDIDRIAGEMNNLS